MPSPVLAQLGNRVQHALRAFTPEDADALRKTARTFPMTEFYDVEKTITSLGIGEALVTVLSPRGVPTPLARDAAAAARLADGAARRGPVPGAGRDEPVRDEVRHDRRSRQRLRADHRAHRGCQGGLGQAAADAAVRAGVDPTTATGLNTMTPAQQQREITRQAREMAAAQKAAERERKAQEKAAAGRGAGPAEDDRHRHPDRRQGGHLAAGPGPDPRRLRDAVRGRQGSLSSGSRNASRSRPGARTWLDPVWKAEALGWATAELAALGSSGGRPDRAAARPAVVDRAAHPDRRGDAWFKATGPGPAYEGALLELFRTLGVRHVVLPITVHPARPWLLFDDAGPTLRATRPDGHGDHDLARVGTDPRRIRARSSGRSRAHRPERRWWPRAHRTSARIGCPRELDRLLDDDVAWARITPDESTAADAARIRLQAALPAIRAVAGELATAGVAATIEHGDFHGGNIVVGREGDRFFDWGDAAVAHPFATLTTTFNSIAHKTGRRLDDAVFDRLQDAYLEAWTDVLPAAALRELAGTSRLLGCIDKALAWERSLMGLEDGEMDGHGDAVAGWLVEFDERLRARTQRRAPGGASTS